MQSRAEELTLGEGERQSADRERLLDSRRCVAALKPVVDLVELLGRSCRLVPLPVRYTWVAPVLERTSYSSSKRENDSSYTGCSGRGLDGPAPDVVPRAGSKGMTNTPYASVSRAGDVA